MSINRLVGSDGGETNAQFLEDINETLEDTSVFLHSPVKEAGVDITVNVKRIYGTLRAKSDSQPIDAVASGSPEWVSSRARAWTHTATATFGNIPRSWG